MVSEQRKADIDALLSLFLKKQRLQKPLATEDQSSLMYSPDSHSFPNLSAGMLEKFIANYWAHVDKSLSIVHQPTFSVNSCHVLLLLAIVMLGAADVVRSKPKGYLDDYKEFSDLIATHLRWEIFTDGDAQPPVQLWVAQALLLLEFYEKQWSTRKLHERAHIHHASTLTLLRRGSPLVGRSESESPVSGMPTRCATPALGDDADSRPKSAFDSWWIHWVRTESFNRVVFAAFQMDTLHAVMYGHAAGQSRANFKNFVSYADLRRHGTLRDQASTALRRLLMDCQERRRGPPTGRKPQDVRNQAHQLSRWAQALSACT